MSTQVQTKPANPTIHSFDSVIWEEEDEPDFEEPTLVHLFTITGMLLIGYWSGEMGEHYTAWAPLYPEEGSSPVYFH